MIKSTKKDNDILYELSINARMNISNLAKKVRLSKQVVSYRLKQLEKNKVIIGYYAITNVYRLGKTHYRVFIKYQNMDKEQEEKFMNYLIKHPKIVWVTYFDGDLDAAFLIWANNIMEFEKVYDEINEKFGIYFQEKYFSIATNIEYLKYKFLCDKINSDSLVFGDSYSNYELDELDKFILQELNINGRITLIELASKYNTSAKVIKSRIDKLVKNKIIIGFNIKLNHTLLGYTHRKILLKINNPSKEKIAQMITYLKTNKNVIYLVKPVGSFDFEFEIMTISNQEFHDIVKDLRSKFAKDIKSYNTVIHYFEPKSGQLVKF